MNSQTFRRTIVYCLLSLVFLSACDKDDDNDGVTKLVINSQNEYEYADLWVVLHDPVTDEVLQASHFTEKGVHEIPNAPSVFALTLVQYYGHNMARISTFPNVQRHQWTLFPLISFAFPDGEVFVSASLPDDSILEVTATLPGSAAAAEPFQLNGETWAFFSLNYRMPLAGKLKLLVTARGQDRCYANWLVDQAFSGEHDFRSINVQRLAHRQEMTFSSPINSFYALGYDQGNDGWPYILHAQEEDSQFTRTEFAVSDFPVDANWLSIRAEGDTQLWFMQKSTTFPEQVLIPQSAATFEFDDANGCVDNIAINGSADAVSASWGKSSFEHSVIWTVYAPGTSDSIVRPALPDSVLNSVGNWDEFELRSFNLYDYHPASDWGQFVRVLARGSTILESGQNSAYSLTYRNLEHTANSTLMNIEDLVSCQLAISPQ